MNTPEHKIELRGPGIAGDRISGHLLRDLLDTLVEGAERALRFRIEGRSTVGGPQPKWLRPASEFSVRATGKAGEYSIQARALFETMPERFGNRELFTDLDPNRSPIELFEDALEDALAGNEDSDRLDAALTKTIERLTSLFEHGVDRIEIVNGRTIGIDAQAASRVKQLAAKSYAPQRVRIAGRLEAIRYSDCRFTLMLTDGSVLQGTAMDLGHETLAALFGKPVLVTGHAVFRASGRPLRVEAERLEPADERETKIWSTVPKPLLGPAPTRPLRLEGDKGGLSAMLGKWPGDESDEEVRAALESLR